MTLEGDRKPASKCVHLGFLELLAKGSSSLQLPETVKPTRSGPANWRVGRNCEEMQMRSGVVRDEIGGGKWQIPSRYFQGKLQMALN